MVHGAGAAARPLLSGRGSSIDQRFEQNLLLEHCHSVSRIATGGLGHPREGGAFVEQSGRKRARITAKSESAQTT
jgi:hypothetical protein